jgi:NADH-quinone oxidoreductase subunit A
MTPVAAYLLLFLAVGAAFILINLLVGKMVRPARPTAEKGTIYECGEPTIGSAWVQFDLRYYVIALLFVIFDVEVAFFFPWAVVFGKANEVASIEAPTDLASHRAYAQAMRDLIPPQAKGPEFVEGKRYEGLARLTPEEEAALKKLTDEQRSAISALGRANTADLLGLDPAIAAQNLTILKEWALVQLRGRSQAQGGGGAVDPKEVDATATAMLAAIKSLTPEQLAALDKVTPLAIRNPKEKDPKSLLKSNEVERNRDQAHSLAWLAFWEIAVFFGVLLVGFAYLWSRGDLAWVRSLAERGVTAGPAISPLAARKEEAVAGIRQ